MFRYCLIILLLLVLGTFSLSLLRDMNMIHDDINNHIILPQSRKVFHLFPEDFTIKNISSCVHITIRDNDKTVLDIKGPISIDFVISIKSNNNYIYVTNTCLIDPIILSDVIVTNKENHALFNNCEIFLSVVFMTIIFIVMDYINI